MNDLLEGWTIDRATEGRRAVLVVRALILALLCSSFVSCGALKRTALKNVASTLSETGDTMTSHNDPETIEGAMPFTLALYESLLASLPEHEPLLTATCALYTQYAFGFIAPKGEALQWDDFARSKELQDRALRLAVRGRDFCWRGLEVRFRGVTVDLGRDASRALTRARREHVPLLYWSAASLGAAISAGGLAHPELVNDWPIVRALAERALVLDESWNRGAVHELMITVESQGELVGGSEARARAHFARAVEIQRSLLPGPHIALATGVAKNKQDRGEFERLIRDALAIDPEADPPTRLIVLITQARARNLLAHVDDVFLDGAPAK